MYNVRPEDRISAENLRSRPKMNGMNKCLQDRKLQWFGHMERMEQDVWFSKSTFKVSGSFSKRRPRQTQVNMKWGNQSEKKVSKDPAKDRNA